MGGSPVVQLGEGRFGAEVLREGLKVYFQVKKGGTAEVNLSSLTSRDEGFFYFY